MSSIGGAGQGCPAPPPKPDQLKEQGMTVWAASDGSTAKVFRVEFDYDDVPGRVWEIGGPDSMYPLTHASEDWRTYWVELVPASASEPVTDPVKVELAVMQECLSLLAQLPMNAQDRVVRWLDSKRAQAYGESLGIKK